METSLWFRCSCGRIWGIKENLDIDRQVTLSANKSPSQVRQNACTGCALTSALTPWWPFVCVCVDLWRTDFNQDHLCVRVYGNVYWSLMTWQFAAQLKMTVPRPESNSFKKFLSQAQGSMRPFSIMMVIWYTSLVMTQWPSNLVAFAMVILCWRSHFKSPPPTFLSYMLIWYGNSGPNPMVGKVIDPHLCCTVK